MLPSVSQYILAHDGYGRGNRVRPDHCRPDKDAYADARDIGARKVFPLSKDNPRKEQFDHYCRADGCSNTPEATEDPKRKMPNDKDN